MSPTRHVRNVWWCWCWCSFRTVAERWWWQWPLSEYCRINSLLQLSVVHNFNKPQKEAVVAAPKHCQKTSHTSLVYTCLQLTASDWSVPGVTITSSWCHSSVPSPHCHHRHNNQWTARKIYKIWWQKSKSETNDFSKLTRSLILASLKIPISNLPKKRKVFNTYSIWWS